MKQKKLTRNQEANVEEWAQAYVDLHAYTEMSYGQQQQYNKHAHTNTMGNEKEKQRWC